MNGTTVGLQFSKPVDPTTATDKTKYNVNGQGAGVGIILVTMRPDGKSVIVNMTAALPGCSFTVSETGVLDACPKRNSTTSTATGHYSILATAQDIGISGDPSPDGTTTVLGDGTFELTAGGSDIWGTDDHGQFAYTTLVDSFDVQVKVTRLDFLNTWSKAGLFARVTADDNSPNIDTYFTPAAGANGIEAGARQTVGGGTGGYGAGGCGGAGCNINDTPWLRLTRTHNSDGSDEFVAYHAPDSGGAPGAWISHADTGVLPAGSIPDSLLVGLLLTSHNNGNATTADYTGLSIIGSGTARSAITTDNAGHVTITWPDRCATLQGATTLGGAWSDIAGSSPVTVADPGIKFFRTIHR